MIKILHCGDLHLDSPLKNLDVTKSEMRRNELRAAFTSMTMFARTNRVDFLLIAGDLFDAEFVSKDTVALIGREFAAMPDCRIIIAPGNHDPYNGSSYYKRAEFPDNVYIFDSEEVQCIEFPDKNTTVYGYAFTGAHMTESPLGGISVEDPSRINILLAHGDLDAPSSQYSPLSTAELSSCGFDYIALGHKHTHETMRIGSAYAAYCGCIDGRGFDECGEKGAVMAVADKQTELKFASKFVRFGKRVYTTETLDVSGAKSNADVLEKIGELVSQKSYADDVALRLRLTGTVSGDFKLSRKVIGDRFEKFFIFELVDETAPVLDGEMLRRDPTVKGAFYRSLEAMLESDDPEERECAALALRCGLAAISGNDFADI